MPAWWKKNHPRGVIWKNLDRASQQAYIQQGKPQDVLGALAKTFGQNLNIKGVSGGSSNAASSNFQYLGVPGGQVRGPKGHVTGYMPGSPSIASQHDPYATTGPQSFRMDQKRPLYVDGDQFKPGGGNLTTDEIIDLQSKMNQLGLYKGKTYHAGVWDQVDAAAYSEVLSGANINFQDANTYLQYRLDHPELEIEADDGSGGGGKAGNVIQLTSPEDIRSVARSTARELYGEDLPESTMQNLIDSFHQVESSTQANYNAMAEAGAGTDMQTPSLNNYIEEQIRQRDPAKVAGHDFGSHMDRMIQNLTTSPGA
jgi:hypothetical protein